MSLPAKPLLTLTLDLEDESGLGPARLEVLADRILVPAERLGFRATVFVVGQLAHEAPGLIRRLAARGHEIAFHAHAHVPLPFEDPARFRQESQDDKKRLEDLAGKPVLGFRAPGFSLTPQTTWALDALAERGFTYTSSVVPGRIARYGFPGAPRVPFRWPQGLVEFPVPTLPLVHAPYLGGIYLYAVPLPVTRWIQRRAGSNGALWTYTHAQDMDTDGPYHALPNTPTWMSWLLWYARRRAVRVLPRLLESSTPNRPLGERAADKTPLTTFQARLGHKKAI